jgi:hypothetical protein
MCIFVIHSALKLNVMQYNIDFLLGAFAWPSAYFYEKNHNLLGCLLQMIILISHRRILAGLNLLLSLGNLDECVQISLSLKHIFFISN